MHADDNRYIYVKSYNVKSSLNVWEVTNFLLFANWIIVLFCEVKRKKDCRIKGLDSI